MPANRQKARCSLWARPAAGNLYVAGSLHIGDGAACPFVTRTAIGVIFCAPSKSSVPQLTFAITHDGGTVFNQPIFALALVAGALSR
jgi:hypothetical protein